MSNPFSALYTDTVSVKRLVSNTTTNKSTFEILQEGVACNVQQLDGDSSQDVNTSFGSVKAIFGSSFDVSISIADKIVYNGKDYDIIEIFIDNVVGTRVFEIHIK